MVITVFPNPNISISTTSAVSCPGSTVVLTASGASSYTWGSGATTNTIVISPTISTTYSVSGTSSNGCLGNATYNQIVTPCVGIEELLSNSETIDIYPNPNNGHFNMIISALNGQEAYLEITDMSGRIILKLSSTEQITPIDIENISSGIYFYSITVGNAIKKGKVIKE
ncbi:MAG: T9SS type A sorting domain-containing protein [Bacteroidota bacterium]